MYVHSTSVLLKSPSDQLKTLEAEVKHQTGLYFRRVNRYILLSLAGAHQCIAGHTPGPGTAVCLTTENGSVGDTEISLGQIFHDRAYPKPYNFINTMSNTASFYIAQSLKLQSRNITVAASQFAFERGLELMRADLACGVIETALVGGVDEAVFSEARLQGQFAGHLVDGSAWMYLSANQGGAAGEIRDLRSFAGTQSALAWLQGKDLQGDLVLAFGLRVAAEERRQWQRICPGAERFDYIEQYGYSDSVSACGICGFFQRFKRKTLVHVSKDVLGRYTLLTASVY